MSPLVSVGTPGFGKAAVVNDMSAVDHDVDVVVTGGGNAGFCVAHAAAENGARPLLLQRGREAESGGNSYYTAGAFRLTRWLRGKGLTVAARTVVLASGGFESSPRMRVRYLGEEWAHALVRGTPLNTGEVLEAAISHGAAKHGDRASCHSVAWDADAPPGGGDRHLTDQRTRQSYPIGVVVNKNGRRFLDEGADVRNHTYAEYGAEILRQPGGIAFQLFDARTVRCFGPRSATASRSPWRMPRPSAPWPPSPGGSGLTAGAVYGRAAGMAAATTGAESTWRGVEADERTP